MFYEDGFIFEANAESQSLAADNKNIHLPPTGLENILSSLSDLHGVQTVWMLEAATEQEIMSEAVG